MGRFIKIAFAAVFFIFFNLPNGSADGVNPALPTIKKFTEVRKSWVKRELLKNGIVTLIEESHKAPLTAIQARIKTGSAAENGYLGSGISHLVEHMLFKGTPKWPRPGAIERRIKSLGGYINAFTSHDSTDVVIIVPSAHTYEALDILHGVLTESLFDPAELDKEREVILKEIRLHNDNPSRYLSQLLWSNVFHVHNYRFPVIGYEDLLKKLSREDLVTYYKTRYIPDNIILGIVGDIDGEDTSKRLKGLFGSIERVSPHDGYSKEEPPQIAPLEIKEERDINLTYFAMGFRGVSIRDKDMFSLDVLSMLLGDGEDSRLFKSLRKEKSLVYSIASYNYTPKDAGIFAIQAALKNEDTATAIEEIWKQVESFKTRFVPDKELKKAKNRVLSSYIFSRQTVQGKAVDLVGNEALTGDYDFSRKYVEGIGTVTKEAILEAAKKYLRKETLTMAKLIPKETKKHPEVKKETASGLVFDIEGFKLKNNLRVFIIEDRALPIVSLNALGMGGLRTETFSDSGIANLVSQTLLCGTKTMNEEEIFSRIEGAGASLNSFSGSNTFGISAVGLSRDFNLIAGIFSDVLENPLFSPEKIEREKAATRTGIKSIDDDIYKSGIRTLKYTLFRRHPYRFQAAGRPSSVQRISANVISDYYRTYYCPANMVLTVSGDIDKKTAKEKITALFEKFEDRPSPKINPPRETKRHRPRILKRASNKEQSLILLGYPGTTIYNHDNYSLEVLSSVLSGTNGRLSKTIREERGLAYTLDAVSLPGIEPGMIVFYIGTAKENLDSARRELFKEIGLLMKDGITDEELQSAKSELIGRYKMGLQKIQDIASSVCLDELYGFEYGNFLQYEDRINHITKECVLRTARKYLNNCSYVLLTIEGIDKDKKG